MKKFLCFKKAFNWAIIPYLVLVDVYPAVYEDVVHLHENKDHVQDGVGAKDQVIALNKTHGVCESILFCLVKLKVSLSS